MSVDHSAFLGIGRRMFSIAEVNEFLLEKTKLTEDDIEMIRDGSYMGDVDVEIVCLDHYSGDDWFVGSSVGKTQNPDKLDECVADALNTWESTFPDEEARVIWAVIYS